MNQQKQVKILIVDDEQTIRMLLIQRLSRDGFHCFEAGNSEEALDKLEQNTIALVLLDIKMPGKSGIELLPEIKAKYPDTAVIMVTATIDIELAVHALKQGAYDYITKPFNLDEVILNVSRALEKRRLELENREYQQHLEDKVIEQTEKIRASFFSAVTSLAVALEAKDEYTHGHSERVAELAAALSEAIGLSRESINEIKLTGLIHDIGKIGVKESVLNKPGRLTEDEFRHIQNHPITGERILSPIANGDETLQLIRHHHERYDGTGYPDKLKGNQIPLYARIIAIADAFEAMTSKRPYRKAMDKKEACAEVKRGKGTQFDPEIADALLRIVDMF